MKVSNSNTKSLIFNILNFEDGIGKNGQPAVITSYPKKYYKAIGDILRRLGEDVLTAYYPSTIEPSAVTVADVLWVKTGEKGPDGHSRGGDRFSEDEVDLGPSPMIIEALRYMYAMRNELPRSVAGSLSSTLDAVMELEELIK